MGPECIDWRIGHIGDSDISRGILRFFESSVAHSVLACWGAFRGHLQGDDSTQFGKNWLRRELLRQIVVRRAFYR
jgi:hypothetical protein